MKILLTGCNGNLGVYLTKELKDEIVGVGRDEWAKINDYFDTDIDTIIHSAYDLKSKVGVSPEKLLSSNVLSTAKLLELAKDYKVKRFVFISSCAVYGDSTDTQEDQLCAPISINGIVKLLNEKVIQEFCNNNGIKCEIYRLFNMYGGNDNFSIINRIKNAAQNNAVLNLNNNGFAQRDFIHVSDVAKIIVSLMDIEHGHAYVNIGTGVGTKIIDIIECVQKKHPDLIIENKASYEVAVSVSNVERLHSLIKYSAMDIITYLSDI